MRSRRTGTSCNGLWRSSKFPAAAGAAKKIRVAVSSEIVGRVPLVEMSRLETREPILQLEARCPLDRRYSSPTLEGTPGSDIITHPLVAKCGWLLEQQDRERGREVTKDLGGRREWAAIRGCTVDAKRK